MRFSLNFLFMDPETFPWFRAPFSTFSNSLLPKWWTIKDQKLQNFLNEFFLILRTLYSREEEKKLFLLSLSSHL